MTKGMLWRRHTGQALAVLSGGSVAAGDLFDDDYRDCPAKTRLRDDQIAELTLARDADEADEVNVSWAATDPATWGLGSNAYHASLVVMLDDGGDLAAKTVSLGTRQIVFDGVATGVEVTAQMAIVVDTADGAYLISDILETTVNQSLSAPFFSTGWISRRYQGTAPLVLVEDPTGRHRVRACPGHEALGRTTGSGLRLKGRVPA